MQPLPSFQITHKNQTKKTIHTPIQAISKANKMKQNKKLHKQTMPIMNCPTECQMSRKNPVFLRHVQTKKQKKAKYTYQNSQVTQGGEDTENTKR